jgi:hypothetical protein
MQWPGSRVYRHKIDEKNRILELMGVAPVREIGSYVAYLSLMILQSAGTVKGGVKVDHQGGVKGDH